MAPVGHDAGQMHRSPEPGLLGPDERRPLRDGPIDSVGVAGQPSKDPLGGSLPLDRSSWRRARGGGHDGAVPDGAQKGLSNIQSHRTAFIRAGCGGRGPVVSHDGSLRAQGG
ncbi:hypothetical protein V2A60_000508 [Cordyceps javanica]